MRSARSRRPTLHYWRAALAEPACVIQNVLVQSAVRWQFVAASKAPEFPGPRGPSRVPARTPLNADTSSQPDGLTRRVMLNILEAFFRRPILHLLPLALMLILAVTTVVAGDKEYRAGGTLSVTNTSLLAELTNSPTTATGFETAAAVSARQVSELLGTNAFLERIEQNAELTAMVEQGVITRADIAGDITATADGDNIVRISSSTNNPELAFRLAAATIQSYRGWLVDALRSQGESTEAALTTQRDEKQATVDEASQALTAFIEENPDVPIPERSVEAQFRYEQLTANYERAQEALDEKQVALDQATLQTAQAPDVVNQRVQVLDEPEVPFGPEGRLKKAVLTVAVFGVLGVLLSLASVVLAASLDRTIRVPNDITARFGIDVLAVVPNASR